MNAFRNTLRLLKLTLRRERVRLPVAFLILLGMTIAVPPVFETMFKNDFDRIMMAQTMKNPAMVAMLGPALPLTAYDSGAMMTSEMLLLTIIAVAILNIFIVTRYTRGDEERGRAEVVGSLPVGRLSITASALLYALVWNAALALLSGLGLAALNIESMGFKGSMIYGAALGASGLWFAALAAVFSQLFTTARGANSASMFALLFLYMLRAMGDIGREALSRISPLGLILRTYPYVKDIWWPVAAVVLEAAVLAVAALILRAGRDMDQGYIPQKRGRSYASGALSTSFGLTLRLTRNSMLAWLIGMFIFGAMYGSIMGDLEAFLNGNALFKQMLRVTTGYSMIELFIAMLLVILSMAGTVPVLLAVKKLWDEEKRGRIDPVVARGVKKTAIIANYAAVGAIASVLMPFAAATGLYLVAAPALGTISYSQIMLSAAMYVPAVFVMLGLAVFIVGIMPRLFSVAWGYLGVSFFVVYLGRLMNLPEAAKKLSPFGIVPQLPIDEMNVPLLTAMTLIAAALAAVGIVGYRRRDIGV